MGRDHRGVPQLSVPYHKGGASVHAPPAVGTHHQHRCTPLLASHALSHSLKPYYGLPRFQFSQPENWALTSHPRFRSLCPPIAHKHAHPACRTRAHMLPWHRC